MGYGMHGGKGPVLTHSSAGLQTLLLRSKVVAIAQAPTILEGLTGHGRAVIEKPTDRPQARTFCIAQLAGIWGGAECQFSLSTSCALVTRLDTYRASCHLLFISALRGKRINSFYR